MNSKRNNIFCALTTHLTGILIRGVNRLDRIHHFLIGVALIAGVLLAGDLLPATPTAPTSPHGRRFILCRQGKQITVLFL